MANLFVASEILEINIAEERNGAVFYSTLSASAKSKKLKKAAAEIARQEKSHEKRFTHLLEKVRQREPQETYPGEFDAYLKALMGKKMFADEDNARELARSKSDVEAVKFALKTEEATLKLLKELKGYVEQDEIKIVNVTIQEEEEHVTQLNQILKELEK